MKIKEGFVIEKVGESYLAVAVGGESFSGLVRMNSTGAFLWNIMSEASVSEDELVARLLSAYEDVTEEVARAGVSEFCKKLIDAGILED